MQGQSQQLTPCLYHLRFWKSSGQNKQPQDGGCGGQYWMTYYSSPLLIGEVCDDPTTTFLRMDIYRRTDNIPGSLWQTIEMETKYCNGCYCGLKFERN